MPTAVSEPARVFWARYNARFEFPTSMALATLLVTTMFLLLIALGLWATWGRDPAPPMTIKLIEDGNDDNGRGAPGPAVTDLNLTLGSRATPDLANREKPLELDFSQLNDHRDPKIPLVDPLKVTPLTDSNASKNLPVGDDVRKMLRDAVRPKGDGKDGPGGDGTDTVRARSLRWVLRFKTRDGRDYLAQLKALNAIVLVPVEPTKAHIFRPKELDDPKPGTFVTEMEWKTLSQQIQFCDNKKDSAEAVGKALNLDFTLAAFWAFFPKELEAELARKEVAYRNRRPEDIAETVFQVTMRAGTYELIVIEQKRKW